MDPATNAFTPQNDIWRLSNALKSFQDTQQDHADRLSRVERRQDEDARVKSVWGPTSPFPGVLSGTPQHGPSRSMSRFFPSAASDVTPASAPPPQSSAADFTTFDDEHSNNMIRSLHLDADDEPRRLGATSRANSVRFDESANQGQLSHASRPSIDLNSRTSSTLGGLGGLPLFERSSSHKSDGRHSSAGQSAVSGRANSLGLDTSSAMQQQQQPAEPPGLTPGLLLLGTVPSIIRCWLSHDFSHDTLLYAAICSGSYKSFLNARLLRRLGLLHHMHQDINGEYRAKLPIYLPEAVIHPLSSRSSSPAQQLPSLDVDFSVLDHGEEFMAANAIQIFVGSDLLRACRADISFVSNSLTVYDDESSKLCIPLVRPEHESIFKNLYTTNISPAIPRFRSRSEVATPSVSLSKPGSPKTSGEEAPPSPLTVRKNQEESPSTVQDSDDRGEAEQATHTQRTINGQDHDRKPSLSNLDTSKSAPNADALNSSPPNTSSARTSSSPAIWSNWRREGGTSQASANDWANVSRGTSANYARPNRDQGIKVLRPGRQTSRSSNNLPSTSSPTVTGQTKFFEETKKRNGPGSSTASGAGSDSGESSGNLRRSASLENNAGSRSGSKENAAPQAAKHRSVNPVGGASAFGWLSK